MLRRGLDLVLASAALTGVLSASAVRAWPPPAETVRLATFLDDRPTIADEWRRLMAGGAELEAAGELLAAHERYRQVEAAFVGLRDAASAAVAVARLERDPELKKQRRERRRWDAIDERYSREKVPLLRQAADSEARTAADELRRTLDIDRLKSAAEGDGYEAVAAKRMLHRVFTQASFYLPRQWLAERNYRAARAALTVALSIRDDSPTLWYNLACAAARTGQAKQALAALEAAVDRGFGDAEHLRRDEDLANLRDRPEFQRLLDRLAESPVP